MATMKSVIKETYKQLRERQSKEIKTAVKNDSTGDGFIFDMFDYELSNHEYCVTCDPTDAVEALGYTVPEVMEDSILANGLNLARRSQWETMYYQTALTWQEDLNLIGLMKI